MADNKTALRFHNLSIDVIQSVLEEFSNRGNTVIENPSDLSKGGKTVSWTLYYKNGNRSLIIGWNEQ